MIRGNEKDDDDINSSNTLLIDGSESLSFYVETSSKFLPFIGWEQVTREIKSHLWARYNTRWLSWRRSKRLPPFSGEMGLYLAAAVTLTEAE